MERLFLLTGRSRGLPVWARYGAATALVLGCLGLRLLVFGPGPGTPFLLFFPAVIVTGVAFDRGTGVYAGLLSALLAAWFLIEPTGSFGVREATDFLALLVFLAVALFTASLLEALHAALRGLASERAALAAANAELAGVAEQRATLLGEAMHRARNDLQRLAATLRLQAAGAAEPAARQALAEASARIAALAHINARLDGHRGGGRAAAVDSKRFLEGLAENLREGAVALRPVALSVAAEAHALPMARAVPVGLVVNELVGNALKHAFPGDAEGAVEVAFRREGDDFVLGVSDNGAGFDPAAAPAAGGGGLGTRIARGLAGQLGGRLDLVPAAVPPCGGDRPGTRWTMRFPAAGPG